VDTIDESVKVRVVEVIVQEAEWRVRVRHAVRLEAAVLAVADRESLRERVNDPRIPPGECRMRELLRRRYASLLVLTKCRLFDPVSPAEQDISQIRVVEPAF
jgi:hypothetical protein